MYTLYVILSFPFPLSFLNHVTVPGGSVDSFHTASSIGSSATEREDQQQEEMTDINLDEVRIPPILCVCVLVPLCVCNEYVYVPKYSVKCSINKEEEREERGKWRYVMRWE